MSKPAAERKKIEGRTSPSAVTLCTLGANAQAPGEAPAGVHVSRATTKHWPGGFWTEAGLHAIWFDQKALWRSPFRLNRHQAEEIVFPLTVVTAGLIASDPRTRATIGAHGRGCKAPPTRRLKHTHLRYTTRKLQRDV